MTDRIVHPGESLPAFLARRARGASDVRLALDLGGGVLAAGAAALVRLPAWPALMCAAVCFAAYGGWGIADRELSERAGNADAGMDRALRAARAAAAAVGAGAGGALVLSLLSFIFHGWIS